MGKNLTYMSLEWNIVYVVTLLDKFASAAQVDIIRIFGIADGAKCFTILHQSIPHKTWCVRILGENIYVEIESSNSK